MEINNGTNVLNKLKGNDVEKYFKLKEEIQSITKTLNNEVSKNKENMSSMINKDKEELSSMKINYENQIKELQDKLSTLEQNNKDLNNKLTKASIAKQETIQSNLKYTEEQYSSMVSKYQAEISQKENEYKINNEKLNNSNKELSKQIESLKKELQSKDQEIQNIKSQKQTSTAKTSSNSNYNPNIQDIIKRHESEFKKIQNETSRKLDTEIKELNDKLIKMTENYNTLKLENQSLKKQTDLFHSKNFNADSYEQVLLEQFETMKNAFVRKLEEVNEELNQTKSETRVKLYNMEQELKDTKRLKDVFLEQVVQLQKQLEN
jgi:chromosome segregation ATPase